MLNENAKAWVAALRSDNYQQGRHFLNDGGRYCCLGVACEIYAKAFPLRITHKKELTLYNDSPCQLPEAVQRWLSLKENNGSYQDLFLHRSLSIDNDTGKTFAEIADIIESAPEGLFVSNA